MPSALQKETHGEKGKESGEIDKMERMLYDAAFEGNVSLLLSLLREDPLILHRFQLCDGNFTGSPLHLAAKLGFAEFAAEILNRKPELAEELDPNKSSPLHLASARGHLEIVKFLLTVNPSMCLARDFEGRNPLHLAALNGQLSVLEELVRVVPRAARERVSQAGDTVLHLCVKYKRLEALKLLVNSSVGDDEMMNAKDGDGNGILHLAVADKELEAIKIILSNDKIKKNAQNANGFTALDIFTESSKDANKDREIKNVLQRAKFLRAVDIGDPNTWQKQIEWLETHRGALMVVASLIATMAFQAGLSPPGGVWQDATHENGTAVLAHTRPIYYNVYVLTTTIALASSVSIIILLLSGLPCKRVSVGFIMVLMWIALMATMNTYLISMHALTPKDGYTMAIPVIRILSWVWSSLVGLLLLGHILSYFVGIVKMAVQLVRGVWKGFSSKSMDPPGA